MPGDFTTTSQCLSAASPLLAVANTWRPSTSPGGGRSSTSTGSTPSVRSRARLATPSTPRPQTPTRAPRRSDQQILGRIAVRDEVVADRPEQLGGIGQVGQAGELGGKLLQQAGAGAVRPPRREQHGSAALADLADALPGLGVGQRPGQGAEPGGKRLGGIGVGQRLGAAEDGAELSGGQERGEDQV